MRTLAATALLVLCVWACQAQPQRIINRLDDIPDVNLSATLTPDLALVQKTNAAGVRYWTNIVVAAGTGDVTNTYNTIISTNNFFISGKGNTLIITNQLLLNFLTNAVLVTDGQSVTNAVLSGLTYSGGATRVLAVDPATTWPLASEWLFGGVFPRSDSATLNTVGDMSPASFGSGGSITAVANTATKPGHLQAATSTTLGGIRGWESGVTSWTSGRTSIFDCTISLDQAVSNRVWIGFHTANATSTFTSDAPDSAAAAFRFSPQEAGDTQLMCYTKQDAGGATDTTSTGLTVVSNTTYRLRIVITPLVNVKYYTNGVLAVTTTTMPTNTSVLRIMWGVETRVSGADRAMDWWGTTIKQSYP